jgi:hypothetical protein
MEKALRDRKLGGFPECETGGTANITTTAQSDNGLLESVELMGRIFERAFFRTAVEATAI